MRPILGEITPGMVISYQYQGKLITHRVAGLENGLLVTRGDNNQDVDPWRVAPSAVVGTPWLRLPYLGHLIFFLRTPAGWGLLVILPAVWIIYDELRKMHRLWREARQP